MASYFLLNYLRKEIIFVVYESTLYKNICARVSSTAETLTREKLRNSDTVFCLME